MKFHGIDEAYWAAVVFDEVDIKMAEGNPHISAEDITIPPAVQSEEPSLLRWAELRLDQSILVSTPPGSDQNSLEIARQRLAEYPAPETFILIEGWPELGNLSENTAARTLWSLVQPVHEETYLNQAEALRTGFPEMTLQLLPLGSTLLALLTEGPLADLPLEDFFSAQYPAGTELLDLLNDLILTAAFSETPLSDNLPEGFALPDPIAAVYEQLAEKIDEAVGGLLVQDDPGAGDGGRPTETHLQGTEGSDTFLLTSETLSVAGGAGLDFLQVSGSVEGFSVRQGETGQIQLDRLDGSAPIILDEIERITFADALLALDLEGTAGQAYRLYQACFDRTPDSEGLGYWIKQLDDGAVSLTKAADYFLMSEEFALVYGTPEEVSGEDYLGLLYGNVLKRQPDESGFEFWRNEQEKGISRADMLVQFSESVENVALVGPAIEDGIWYV